MEQLWPLLILWVIAALLGGARKKRPPPSPQPPARVASPDQAKGGGLMGELGRALEELKRAEQEARRAQTESPRLSQDDAARAKAYLDQRKAATRGGALQPERKVFMPKPRPAAPARVTRRPPMPLADDDADKSSEDSTIEVRDYDEEAEQLVRARRRGADRVGRREGSVEAMSPEQQARRTGVRGDAAIGTRAEHADWHRKLETPAPAPAPAGPDRRGRLARFADGSLRGAVVLGEVLGRPAGER